MAIVNQLGTGQDLDIFLRFNGVLTDPLSISYVIKIPSNLPVASGVGFGQSVGHFDARNSIIPSGYNIADPWTITWTYTAPNSIVGTASEEFTIFNSASAVFTNIDNIIDLIKADMDIGTLTDTQIETLIIKSLIRLNRRLRLTGDAALHIDEDTGEIAPEPSDAILDLVILQTECLLSKRNRSTSVGQGKIVVKDGDQTVETSSNTSGQISVTKDFCDELNDAINDHVNNLSDAGNNGQLIWHGNSREFEDTVNGTKDMRSPFEDDEGFDGRFQ